jgi:hypothetical protein
MKGITVELKKQIVWWCNIFIDKVTDGVIDEIISSQ